MGVLVFILLLAGLGLLTYASFNIMKGLSAIFPFASKSRWWWTKRLPLLGLGFIFLGVANGIIFSVFGIIIIFGCAVWLSYCQKNDISG